MGDLQKLVVHIGQLKSGQWVAATGRSPYFCVESDSEAGVRQLARDAIAFYGRALKQRELAPVEFTSKVTVEELVAA